MREVRLAVICVGCLIAGPVLIARHIIGLPSFDSLTKVTGIADIDSGSRSSRYSSATYPVICIDGRRYAYLDWFPNPEQIPGLVQAGDKISIWTDAAGNEWVWQIEKDGRVLVPYESVRKAVAYNNRFDLYFGIGVLVLAALGGVMLYRRIRSNRPARRPYPERLEFGDPPPSSPRD